MTNMRGTLIHAMRTAHNAAEFDSVEDGVVRGGAVAVRAIYIDTMSYAELRLAAQPSDFWSGTSDSPMCFQSVPLYLVMACDGGPHRHLYVRAD